MPGPGFRSCVALALSLLTLPAARADDEPFRCQARGGRPWREVTTEHFAVDTDLGSGAARELAVELETMHHAVRFALFKSPPPLPGRMRVVAFRDLDAFRRFAPEGAAAFYTESRDEPTMVMHEEFGDEVRFTAAHEIAHSLLARALARQPLWFAEGMACYLETVGTSGPDQTPTVGGINAVRRSWVYPYHGGVSKVLLARDRLDGSVGYGTAWALVHYLVNAKPKEFGDLLARFTRGQDPAVAWREVFPAWDPADAAGMEQLDDEIGRHLAHGKFGYRTVQLVKEHPTSERPLPAGEVHAIRLGLWPRGLAKDDASKAMLAEMAEALAEDPAHVQALSMTDWKPEEARAAAARATAAHPDDPRAWIFAASAASKAPEREAALRRAVTLAPDWFLPLNELAWMLVQTEREGEAIPVAARAVSIAPGSAPSLDTLAAALQGVGRCPEALGIQRRAIDVLSERVDAQTRKRYADRADTLERTCGPARPATAKP